MSISRSELWKRAKNRARLLSIALGFLTTLPVPARGAATCADLARSTALFPLVGLWLGLLLIGADALLARLFPQALQAALTLALWVALTGALHLDGLVDCCDALFAPLPPDRRLEILRDVHVGAFGVVGAVLLLLIKFAALVSLPAGGRTGALLLAPTLARWALPYAMRAYPYARSGPGLGRSFRELLTWREVTVASAVAGLAALAVAGLTGLLALVAAWLTVRGMAWWVRRRIPGLTGDVYGAIAEAVELVTLLVFCAA